MTELIYLSVILIFYSHVTHRVDFCTIYGTCTCIIKCSLINRAAAIDIVSKSIIRQKDKKINF